MEKNFLFGVGITNARENEILEYILKGLKNGAEKYYIVTPNPEILVYASKHNGYKDILNNARLALCDGIGLIWAGKILGKSFKKRVTGVDFLEMLCNEVSKKPITVGFLGGGPKIAERVAECLKQKYPGLKVVFAAPEWPENEAVSDSYLPLRSLSQLDEFSNASVPASRLSSGLGIRPVSRGLVKTSSHGKAPRGIIEIKRYSNIDILFVAFGFPKQEEWISKNLDKIPVKVAIGVGGAFDYLSGKVPRAPFLIRQAGFEWLYRLIRQPWRIKRQLALLEFIYLILKEKFFHEIML